jgi:hypothetical protein
MLPLPRAKTWDPSNQACNAVYAICMSEARKGAEATAASIISKIRESPALEMTPLELIIRAISKAIMDIYDEDIEQQHMDQMYLDVTAMEEAKEWFEEMFEKISK